jgi:homoserine kinase
VLVLADGPGRRLDAAELVAGIDTSWEALMLAVDVRGGTVKNTEGSTSRT